jgi:hypothetical protein
MILPMVEHPSADSPTTQDLRMTMTGPLFAFIHMEKAAGTTLTSILRRSFGTRHCDVRGWRNAWIFEDDLVTAADMRRTQWIYPNLVSIAGHGVRPYSDLSDICPDVRYYTILREPIARCASNYQYQVQVLKKTMPFEEWIQTERMRDLQTRRLVGTDDVGKAREMLSERVGIVGLVDFYDETLVMLRRFFGDLPLSIRYRPENIASDSSISRDLLDNPKTYALLEEANRNDMALYEHVRQEIFPKQKAAYGPELERDVAAFTASLQGAPPGREPIRSALKRRYMFQPALRTWYRLKA